MVHQYRSFIEALFRDRERVIAGWLLTVCLAVFCMVVVGGITRLTGSGLSMVDWRPVLGIVPPLSEAAWQAAFDAYRQYPEYQQVNRGMTLAEFRFIFFWEYGHRLLGRLVGLLYVVPLLLFWWRGWLDGRLKVLLLVGLLLGGGQGLLGWYMVQSGLVDMPRVSHYRLAAHLSLALLVMVWLFWIALELMRRRAGQSLHWQPAGAVAVVALGLLTLQIFFGALVAGLHAGWGYNTFPKMNDQWVAATVFALEPWWRNFFDNAAMVQFVHRSLGLGFLLLVTGWWLAALRRCRLRELLPLHLLLVVTLSQVVLGVVTLVNVVPPLLAALHQALACLLLLVLVFILFCAVRVRRFAPKSAAST